MVEICLVSSSLLCCVLCGGWRAGEGMPRNALGLLPAGWFCYSYCHVSGIRLTFASKKLLVTLDDK